MADGAASAVAVKVSVAGFPSAGQLVNVTVCVAPAARLATVWFAVLPSLSASRTGTFAAAAHAPEFVTLTPTLYVPSAVQAGAFTATRKSGTATVWLTERLFAPPLHSQTAPPGSTVATMFGKAQTLR